MTTLESNTDIIKKSITSIEECEDVLKVLIKSTKASTVSKSCESALDALKVCKTALKSDDEAMDQLKRTLEILRTHGSRDELLIALKALKNENTSI